MWDLDDLAATSDIAHHFNVGQPAVSNWISRNPDFPGPLVVVAMGATKLYSRQAVIDWHVRRFPHHGSRQSA